MLPEEKKQPLDLDEDQDAFVSEEESLEPADQELDTGSASQTATKKRTSSKVKRISWRIERPHWQTGKRFLVGVDEAGRGPLAGPVVAAAVVFPYELCQKLPKGLRGLNDSKQVPEPERERLFEEIKTHALAFGIGVISGKEIDEINILRATMKAMTVAVDELASSLAAESCAPELLLIDGNYFRTTLPYEFQTVIDGDAKSPLIAAASILAKVTRDRIMKELDAIYPQYNFGKHKGYGTPEHRKAIKEHGLCPEHRISFTSKHAANELLLFTDAYDAEFFGNEQDLLEEPFSEQAMKEQISEEASKTLPDNTI